jgi:hypothetical protein
VLLRDKGYHVLPQVLFIAGQSELALRCPRDPVAASRVEVGVTAVEFRQGPEALR